MNDDSGARRDAYLVLQALALAVALMPHLPVKHQAHSDRADMLQLLRAEAGEAMAEFLLATAAEKVAHIEERYAPRGGA